VGPPAGDLLAVGRIRRPHGIHGEVTVDVTTDFPERLVAGQDVVVGNPDPQGTLHIDQVRWHKGAWLVAFAGVDDRDKAEGWRGFWLYLPAQERSALPPTYYYEHELEGLRCVDVAGRVLGTVTALDNTTGTALLRVRIESGEVLVPFTSPIVVRVELPTRTVVLDPPRGLFDGDAL
jgi:16S rRNA processing protein RimM